MDYNVSIHTSGRLEKGDTIKVVVNGKSFSLLRPGARQQETLVRAKELLQMLDKLAEEYRVPFLMSVEGMDFPQISKILNLSVVAVKARVFYARKKLRHLISASYAS